MLCGFDSREFGASGEDSGVLGKAVAVIGGRVRVGRVRLRANVLDASVAVANRLVDESEIGVAVARARREVASQGLCDHGLVVAEGEACWEGRADDEGGDALQCEKVAYVEHNLVEFRLECTECGALLYV